MTWEGVDAAAVVVGGLLAFARADLVSSEFGLKNAGATGALLFARFFGSTKTQVNFVLDRAYEAGGQIPSRCMHKRE